MEKQTHTNSHGFTIIELLLIVAILAALASIVLDNVTAYTTKAKDIAIKESIAGILINGSIYFEKYDSYNAPGPGDFCDDVITLNIYNSINSANKNCKANVNQWRVCARLNLPATGTLQAWCADQTGVRKQINDSQCDNSNSPCP